jgi:threonine dehydratase
MELPNRGQIESAAAIVGRAMAPTAQIRWPLLSRRCGAEVWVKHENHTPIGAFKLRDGLVYFHELRSARADVEHVIAATRGNHGQSVAFAARVYGVKATIIVPHGNSAETNTAMRAFGAELIEHGHDFQAAYEHAAIIADERALHMVLSFDSTLVRGVATCGFEFLSAVGDLEAVYVPIGLGSGICGMIAAREALGLRTLIIGVVAENAPAYALSFEGGKPVPTTTSETIADGIACRVPEPDAVAVINRHAERIVRVTEDEIRAAMRHYFTDTHNAAEGAGAAPLAALLKERDQMAGRRVGLVLTGGNVDRAVFARVLSES